MKREEKVAIFGKNLRRFRPDADGGIQYLEMECLKYALGMLTVSEKNTSHIDLETDIIPAWDLVAGPLKVTLAIEASA